MMIKQHASWQLVVLDVPTELRYGVSEQRAARPLCCRCRRPCGRFGYHSSLLAAVGNLLEDL